MNCCINKSDSIVYETDQAKVGLDGILIYNFYVFYVIFVLNVHYYAFSLYFRTGSQCLGMKLILKRVYIGSARCAVGIEQTGPALTALAALFIQLSPRHSHYYRYITQNNLEEMQAKVICITLLPVHLSRHSNNSRRYDSRRTARLILPLDKWEAIAKLVRD